MNLYSRRLKMLLSFIFMIVSLFLSVLLTEKVFADNDLINILPNNMTKITPDSLQYIYGNNRVDGTASVQGFAVTDKYFVVVQLANDESNSKIMSIDMNNPTSNPIWITTYNVGHGNGMTWNNETNQLVLTDKKDRFFFDANSGNYVKTVTTTRNAGCIAYNSATNQYIEISGMNPGVGRIVSNDFENVITTFDTSIRLGTQDAAYYNNYIYRTAWAGCNYMANHPESYTTDDVNYCNNNFSNGTNVIYQFNNSGIFTNAFYIWSGNNENKWFGEIESLAFAQDGTPYLLFNGKTIIDQTNNYSIYKITDKVILDKMGVSNRNLVLSFDNNGGTGKPNDQTCLIIGAETDCNVTIPDTKPSRLNYEFLGWSTKIEANRPEYQIGDKVSLNKTGVTLYAVWDKIPTEPTNEDIKPTNNDVPPITVPNTGNITGERSGIIQIIYLPIISIIIISIIIYKNSRKSHRKFD